MWHGIDLADIQASRCAGSVNAVNGASLTAWLRTTSARVHFPCLDDALTARLSAAISAVNADLPSTQTVSEDLKLHGTFTSVRVSATWHGLNKITLQFEAHLLLFVPIWSNPLWTQWGFQLDSERGQILAALRLLLLDLPSAPSHRAFAGIDLEVAMAEPLATQWALLLQLYRELSSRFHGGVGSVDAAVGGTISGTFSRWFWWITTGLMMMFIMGCLVIYNFFANKLIHVEKPDVFLTLPGIGVEEEEEEDLGSRHLEPVERVCDLSTPPATAVSVPSSPSSLGSGSFTKLDAE